MTDLALVGTDEAPMTRVSMSRREKMRSVEFLEKGFVVCLSGVNRFRRRF